MKKLKSKTHVSTNSTYKPNQWTLSTTFDSHAGFSVEECRAVLRFFNLPDREFFNWMGGQTCPMLSDGTLGYYCYDLKRYIEWKTEGTDPIWD